MNNTVRKELKVTPIEEMGLSSRSVNGLHRDGIKYVSELADVSRDYLLLIRNIGEKSADEIVEKAKELFGIQIPDTM